MATKKVDFRLKRFYKKCEAIVKEMGLAIQYTQNFDPFFKWRPGW